MSADEPIELRIPIGRNREMAASVYCPESLDPQASHPILFLFPGAGYGRKYFDIEFDGLHGFSQCRHHCRNGFVAIAFDHVGVGDSVIPQEDQPLRIEDLAAACDVAVRHVMAAIAAGTLHPSLPALLDAVAIGAGQSMGGFVIAVAQARHECFAGVVLMGASMTMTDLAMKPGHRRPFRAEAAERRLQAIQQGADMTASFHWHDEPEQLVAADMDVANPPPWRAISIPDCSAELLEPYVIARDAARIRTPVLLVYGEQDVTVEPLADLTVFRSACDLSLLIIPGMAHMHNFARSRARLWQRLEVFARNVVVEFQQADQPVSEAGETECPNTSLS